MPANKSAVLRYRVIDSCLTNSMHKYPTMEYIKEKIEEQLDDSISDSMLTKDFNSMREIYNAPIEYVRAKKGYCYSEEGFSIKEFPLTHAEIEALDYSTALLQLFKDTGLFNKFESAINKVTAGYRINKIMGKSEKQILQVEEPVKSEGSQWLELILKAIVEKECLKINYHGFGKEESQHDFSPYLLKEYRNRWYAVGYSAQRKTILVLALDRVVSIAESSSKYVSEEYFTPEDFFKYSIGITQLNDEKPEKVELLFAPAQAPYVLSQPLHHSQTVIANNDKGLKISLEVYLTYELKMAILAYGAGVKVLAPKKLLKEIKEDLIAMSELYR